jgi:hypothetical protein
MVFSAPHGKVGHEHIFHGHQLAGGEAAIVTWYGTWDSQQVSGNEVGNEFHEQSILEYSASQNNWQVGELAVDPLNPFGHGSVEPHRHDTWLHMVRTIDKHRMD